MLIEINIQTSYYGMSVASSIHEARAHVENRIARNLEAGNGGAMEVFQSALDGLGELTTRSLITSLETLLAERSVMNPNARVFPRKAVYDFIFLAETTRTWGLDQQELPPISMSTRHRHDQEVLSKRLSVVKGRLRDLEMSPISPPDFRGLQGATLELSFHVGSICGLLQGLATGDMFVHSTEASRCCQKIDQIARKYCETELAQATSILHDLIRDRFRNLDPGRSR